MLFEADSPDLEARSGIIDRLAADLKKAGIKFDREGGTALNIYNTVTVAQPIYTAVANKNGAFDIIDKSVERAKMSRLPDGGVKLQGTYNDRGNLMSLHTGRGANTIYYEKPFGGLGMRNIYNSGGISKVSSNDVMIAENGEFLYGHKQWDSMAQDEILVSVDVVRGGQVITYKMPGKREIKNNPSAIANWRNMEKQFFYGKRPNTEQLYAACLKYIVDSIGSSTVNAAIKGGKDKYIIKPAKELIETLESIFDDVIIDSNIDDVANTNADNPVIQFSPEDDITIKIIINRPNLSAKGVIYSIYNTDKTILYADTKKNMEFINQPNYEILLKKITAYSEKNDEGKREFNNGVYSVAKFLVNYLTAASQELPIARKNKAEMQSFTAKTNARLAADAAKKERDIAKQSARLDRKAIADAEKRKANSNRVSDVADSLWGSDEEYDKFLDSLL